MTMMMMINVKKLNSLKQCLRRHGLHHTTKTAKIKKGPITFAARRHNVNVLLRRSTFFIFAVLVV